MRRALALTAAATVALMGLTALAATGDRLARLNLEETALTAGQVENAAILARLLSVLEQLRRNPPPALLVSPQDANAAVRAAILVKAMTPELERRARAYALAEQDLMRLRRLAAIESETLFTRDSEAADRALEPSAPAQAAAAPPPPPPEPADPPAALQRPAPGAIVRRFGDPLPGGGRAVGLSLDPPRGAQVASPGEGSVRYVGPVRGWGVVLILRLSGGYHLVLAGLERAAVAPGQSVAAGQSVGWMPDDRQSRAGLYLEVRDQGAPVDPARWLKE